MGSAPGLRLLRMALSTTLLADISGCRNGFAFCLGHRTTTRTAITTVAKVTAPVRMDFLNWTNGSMKWLHNES